MQRVIWGPAELDGLAGQVVRLMGEGHTILKALKAAQAGLPEDRRRTLTGVHNIPQKLQQLVQQKISSGCDLPAVEVPPPDLPETRASLASLVSIMGNIEHLLSRLVDQHMPHDAPSNGVNDRVENFATERAKRRSVLVVGCNANQFDAIFREWGPIFEITYLHQWRPTMKSRVKTVDVCIGVTRFMDHSTDSILKAHARRYIRVGSPVNDVKDALRVLHATAQN